jgi:3-(3-hydroxy-phenyl)propionate hydroxylase
MERVDTQILIVGAGPCGVTIANHLGMYGVHAIVVDREEDVLGYPRAVGIDDEALRSYQAVGLVDVLLKDMIQNSAARYHTSRGVLFAEVQPKAQPYGWPRRNMFLQPRLEASLREGLKRYPSLRTMFGFEVIDLSQDKTGVKVTARKGQGEEIEFNADYVVGADGGRSTVRQLIGVELRGETDAARWLVVDVEDDHLYAPYSAVYCDVERPHMSIDLPFGHRRFEFRLAKDEQDEVMQAPETVYRLIDKFYPASAPKPKILRSRVYLHHTRVAERFQVGRVFLAGDSAHLQPPFFGQGMNSGLRDATNISWKLAGVVKDKFVPKILETYEAERHDHALAMVRTAKMFGRLYSPGTRFAETLRDIGFRLIQGLPSVKDYILQMRFKPMPRYTEGVIVPSTCRKKDGEVGKMFMQPFVETGTGQRMRLDDAIGNWFTIIGVNRDPQVHLSPAVLKRWANIGGGYVRVNRSRPHPDQNIVLKGTVILDDVAGAFKEWSLQRPQDQFVVLRPDRYVAAMADEQTLDGTVTQLLDLIS